MARAMKDSGIEWIGEIPEGWESKRLKYIVSYNDESLGEDTDPDYEFDYIDIGSVEYGKGITQYQHMRFADSPSRARRVVRDKDVILSTVRTYLKAVATIDDRDNPQIASTGFIVLRAKKGQITPDYLHYSVLSNAFVSLVEAKSTGISYPAINASDVVEIKIPVPPIIEQRRIADYLNSECARIDAVIEQTRASIEEYKKLKQSLITQAVTKGIRPGRKMKDSGVEWIEEIPEEWVVTKLKYFSSIRSGITLGKTYPRDTNLVEYLYLRVANVQGSYTDLTDVATILVTEEEAEKYRLHDGELLMTEGGDRDKLGRGTVWHAEIDPCLHQNHVFALTTNDDLSAEYVSFLSASLVGRDYFDVTANQSVHLASTNSTTIMNFTIPVPSIEEQNEIVSYLTEKTDDLEKLIAKKQTLISDLESYKKSLIFEYVTGKKEVGH